MNIFEFQDYKKVLQGILNENKKIFGFKKKLAQAAKCNPSYFSQVLHTAVELTPDHAIGIAEFLGFSALEKDFFLTLVSLQRASNPSLKALLLEKLGKITEENANLSKRYLQPGIGDGQAKQKYYSSWLYPLVHMLVRIPSHQKIEALSDHLGIPIAEVRQVLQFLEVTGLVKKEKDRYLPGLQSIHLENDSPIAFSHHATWKVKSLDNVTLKKPKDIHYSCLYSLSKKDAEVLRGEVLKFIDRTREVVIPSKDEKVLCFCLDLFEP